MQFLCIYMPIKLITEYFKIYDSTQLMLFKVKY